MNDALETIATRKKRHMRPIFAGVLLEQPYSSTLLKREDMEAEVVVAHTQEKRPHERPTRTNVLSPLTWARVGKTGSRGREWDR